MTETDVRGTQILGAEVSESNRDRLTDEDFKSIVKIGGGSSHELDKLRIQLDEIIHLYRDAIEPPSTEFEVCLDERK